LAEEHSNLREQLPSQAHGVFLSVAVCGECGSMPAGVGQAITVRFWQKAVKKKERIDKTSFLSYYLTSAIKSQRQDVRPK
jgi:hypothetical protein